MISPGLTAPVRMIALMMIVIIVYCKSSTRVFAQTPQDFLIRVVDADKANHDRMVNYLFREDVKVHFRCSPENTALDYSKAYEMIILEGEPYLQLVEENGVSIS